MRPRDRERESQRSGERELNPEPRGPDPLWTAARTEIRLFQWRFRRARDPQPARPKRENPGGSRTRDPFV
jgi:hypothetical protein